MFFGGFCFCFYFLVFCDCVFLNFFRRVEGNLIHLDQEWLQIQENPIGMERSSYDRSKDSVTFDLFSCILPNFAYQQYGNQLYIFLGTQKSVYFCIIFSIASGSLSDGFMGIALKQFMLPNNGIPVFFQPIISKHGRSYYF